MERFGASKDRESSGRPADAAKEQDNTSETTTKRQHFSGAVDARWVNQIKEYYRDFQTGAANRLDDATKKKIEGLFGQLDSNKSMAAGVELWKTMHVMWLKQTDSMADDVKKQLIRLSNDALTPDMVSIISRWSFAEYASHNRKELIEYAHSKGQEDLTTEYHNKIESIVKDLNLFI